MSEHHRPRRGDKFWDGQRRPQPNGVIVWVDWPGKSVVVEFLSSPPERFSYDFDAIADSWVSKYNLYRLNEDDWLEGFVLLKPP